MDQHPLLTHDQANAFIEAISPAPLPRKMTPIEVSDRWHEISRVVMEINARHADRILKLCNELLMSRRQIERVDDALHDYRDDNDMVPVTPVLAALVVSDSEPSEEDVRRGQEIQAILDEQERTQHS